MPSWVPVASAAPTSSRRASSRIHPVVDLALAGTAVGELVDRCELYEELEVPTPAAQMRAELASRLAAHHEIEPAG